MLINLEGKLIGIERDEGADVVYISHAHSDHNIKTNKEVIASNETLSLLGRTEILERSEIDLKNIKLFPAGHMLGSTQILLQNGESIVYTGDFKLRDGYTTKGAEIIECDKLYIDATFGEPCFKFPKKEEISEEINKWVKKINEENKAVIFGAYKLGKAQELIKLLNENDIVPIVDETIERCCKIYEKFGIKLEREIYNNNTSSPLSPSSSNFFDSHSAVSGTVSRSVFIFPFHKVKNNKIKINGVRALVTGWAQKYNFGIKAFPLSDHADFNEILEYVAVSKAKKIICMYTSSHHIITELRKRGYNAKIGTML